MKTNKIKISLKSKNKFFEKIRSIFIKKKKTIKKTKKDNHKSKINIKQKFSDFKKLLNKKIDIKKNNKLTKEMYILIFIIIELILFNFALFLSRIITYEYYNSIEFLALVFLNPFILVVEGIIYGTKFGFSYFVAIILSIVFILSVFVFLKIEFIFYLPIYFIFVTSSEIFGISINKVKRI